MRRAALACRELLEQLGLPSYPKTTGSRGLHVAVPLDGREAFDPVRRFARSAMEHLATRHPDELTTEQRRARRGRRVYLDVGRNAYGQTAVCPYSVRALPGAPVATPLAWTEIERGRLDAQSYTIANLFRRLGQRPDPWKGMRRRARSLAGARERLASLLRGVGPGADL